MNSFPRTFRKHTPSRLFLPFLFLLATSVLAEEELAKLVQIALLESPLIRAAQQRVEQALSEHEELAGFFDPSLYGAGGTSERSRGVPGSTGFTSLRSDANEIQGGVEAPLLPGAYLSAGGAQRFLKEPSGEHNHLHQTLAGARLRIPLLRDRGFLLWDLDRARALAEYEETVNNLLSSMQDLRREVELAYINVLEGKALLEVSREATERFKTLLNEAGELVKLKVIPEYQLSPAQLELYLRQAEEVAGHQLLANRMIQLKRLVGGSAIEVEGDASTLVKWADEVVFPENGELAPACLRRGSYRRIESLLTAARADLRKQEEELHANLELEMGLTWQGEDHTGFIGDGTILTDKHFGGEALLVWRRPLGFRAEHSRKRRIGSRIAELRQQLAAEELNIRSALATYRVDHDRADERRRLISAAMQQGLRTLTAEGERFRLGEGRSRNVLDAQKDVTSIGQLHVRASADVLRARINYLHAAGQAFDE